MSFGEKSHELWGKKSWALREKVMRLIKIHELEICLKNTFPKENQVYMILFKNPSTSWLFKTSRGQAFWTCKFMSFKFFCPEVSTSQPHEFKHVFSWGFGPKLMTKKHQSSWNLLSKLMKYDMFKHLKLMNFNVSKINSGRILTVCFFFTKYWWVLFFSR